MGLHLPQINSRPSCNICNLTITNIQHFSTVISIDKLFKRSPKTWIESYLTSILTNIAVCCHVVLQELDLCKPVATHRANMLLLLVRVMCLHVKGEILLSVELFSTLIARVVEVGGVTHFLVF